MEENNWSGCKNILCIRTDNMGDLVMSGPAIRSLKETFDARITVLTSSMATGIAAHMDEIDEVITFDLPWVKHNTTVDDNAFEAAVAEIKRRRFDAAVVFTVYSQNPLPAVMLAYLAGIPRRLAYCRENPYQLLTHWVPDLEPYITIRHQVTRDLDLVASVGATTTNQKLQLQYDPQLWPAIEAKLTANGLDIGEKWIILHAGVSEAKRQYPEVLWVMAGKRIVNDLGYQIVLTGSASEKQLTDRLQQGIGKHCVSAGGLFSLDELITLIKQAPIMLSVNTGTVHIAAALQTPVAVLYAQTNPQHTPWLVPCKVLPFSVPADIQSRNEVIRYVNQQIYSEPIDMPHATDILNAVMELLNELTNHQTQTLPNSTDEFGGFV